MSSPSSQSLFSHPPFLLYFWARGVSEFSYMIAVVALGWQVYALSDSAFDLGMVGLAQFIPTVSFIFVAGHVADPGVRCQRSAAGLSRRHYYFATIGLQHPDGGAVQLAKGNLRHAAREKRDARPARAFGRERPPEVAKEVIGINTRQ